jgi:hypothetical protein
VPKFEIVDDHECLRKLQILFYWFVFGFWVVLLFVSYELWFVALHVLMVFRFGFGDEA